LKTPVKTADGAGASTRHHADSKGTFPSLFELHGGFHGGNPGYRWLPRPRELKRHTKCYPPSIATRQESRFFPHVEGFFLLPSLAAFWLDWCGSECPRLTSVVMSPSMARSQKEGQRACFDGKRTKKDPTTRIRGIGRSMVSSKPKAPNPTRDALLLGEATVDQALASGGKSGSTTM